MTGSDPMPPMRERIARAIVLNAPNSSPISPDRSLSMADAVLAEIERPSEAMVKWGAKVHPAALCREVFAAMIRAAREGK